jgi:hypothetical protein
MIRRLANKAAAHTRTGRLRSAGWLDARTLQDLADLTARWLEGDIPVQPGYCGRPDGETAELVSTLAAVNRAGFLTWDSQPGYAGLGYDGVWWEQRAAVQGFAGADIAAEIANRAWAANLVAILDVVRNPATESTYDHTVPVSRRLQETTCSYGAHLSTADLLGTDLYGELHPDAVFAVARAWQVTILDPMWGRNDRLWPMLDACGSGSPKPAGPVSLWPLGARS